jgi:hypothetical protein
MSNNGNNSNNSHKKVIITPENEAIYGPVVNSCLLKKGVSSRRQLLFKSMWTGMGSVMMPSFLDMIFARQAFGAEVDCSKATVSAGAQLPAILQFELRAGWVATNGFAVGKQQNGGAFDPLTAAGYSTMGLGKDLAPTAGTTGRINTEFGAPLVVGSPLLTGLLATTSVETRSKISMAIIMGNSADDIAADAQNIVGLGAKVVNAGNQKLVSRLGARANAGGVAASFGRVPVIDFAGANAGSPALITSPASAFGLVNPGLMASRLSAANVSKIINLTKKMSEAQLERFKNLSPEAQKDIICGYVSSGELLGGFTEQRVNPLLDPKIVPQTNPLPGAPVFPALPGNPLADVGIARTVTLAKLLVDGMAAGATHDLPGNYDYHAQSVAQTNTNSEFVGRNIGVACEIAARAGAPLFIVVTSDGSAGAPPTDTNGLIKFTDEAGERGSTLIIAVNGGNPNAIGTRAQMNHNQVGTVNPTGENNVSYLGDMILNSQLQGIVALANYAAFAGKMKEFSDTLAAGQKTNFIQEDIKYLAFKPKA